MNKTKVVATIGPASCSKEKIKELIKAGMDVARINMDHADFDFCKEIVKKVNEVNKELNTSVATMFDTRGPELRVGEFQNGYAQLEDKSKIRIYIDDIMGDSTKFSINYKDLIDDINYDALIMINDGHIKLQVLDKGKDYLLCEVLAGGIIENHKGVNIPGLALKIPFISERDEQDIKLASELNVDFLALSFVGSHDNVLEVNDLLINLNNNHMSIIAKIETEEGYNDIDEIIKVSDGVMVARGDLGVQVPMERVPGMQKNIISKCHMAGKVSIVATEMMTSMENDLLPTRAEVSDVANAVLDGADAVMLTGETTVGKYPVETLEMMEKIITSAEDDIDYMGFMDRAVRTESKDITGMIAHSVAYNANLLDCKAIFAPTMTGYTARKISRFRPTCPIIAASPNEDAVKSLALNFGVFPILIDELKNFDKIIEVSRRKAEEIININSGEKIIITGGYPFKDVKHTNFMKIEEM
ncbi:MAG TPA: pyruvate kinase [Bacilli bacterium]|nr:pyruvate kinase [Bacilli bacterium]